MDRRRRMVRRARVGFSGWVGAAVLCAVGLACTAEQSVTAPDPEALSILFIGNSLTYYNDMPEMVRELLEEADVGPVVVASSSFPNYGLLDHWVDSRSRDAIDVGGWDHILLQQGPSATEGRPWLLEYTLLFDDEIRAVGATTGLYMVWPSAARDFDFDGVVESYTLAAESVDGLLFPGGQVWRAIWSRDPTLQLYGPDGFHPSFLGSYVVALTIADRLIGEQLTLDLILETSAGRRTVDPALGALLLEAVREVNGPL
ncbi:MAG: SGNH/GDSL hydrolase family protein [Longimicrobiales bacterium]